ncbi:MAG: type II toxin-antitoxin system VapC family toxin [Spirochaetes bacterium]|nr:type II toxin-antitoxin system VapC family toxin [Spirochaetota bacterium]
MKVFIDSSALVKRYIEEPGSSRVGELIGKAKEVAVCIVCVPEVLSACNRLVREKRIDSKQYEWIKKEFLLDLGELMMIDITSEVIIRSIQCLEKGALRSLDALHIASAIEYKCGLFVTGDQRQMNIADAMKLKIEVV